MWFSGHCRFTNFTSHKHFCKPHIILKNKKKWFLSIWEKIFYSKIKLIPSSNPPKNLRHRCKIPKNADHITHTFSYLLDSSIEGTNHTIPPLNTFHISIPKHLNSRSLLPFLLQYKNPAPYPHSSSSHPLSPPFTFPLVETTTRKTSKIATRNGNTVLHSPYYKTHTKIW